jgi:CelD/BcsL family acetyltransferase involved in cellulose biosynthesis
MTNIPSDLAFRVEPFSSPGEIAPIWRTLDQVGSGSFFTTWNWIGSWLETLPNSIAPFLVTAEQEGHTIAAAIAFRRRSRRHLIVNTRQLHFNSTGDAALDCIAMEHNDFAGVTGLLPSFVRRFSQDSDCDELFIPGVSVVDITASAKLLHTKRKQPAFANRELATIVREGMGSVLSRNARQQLRKSLKDFSSFGALRVEEAATTEAALDYFDALKSLHILSWTRRRKPHAFRHPYFEKFHRALIAAGAPCGAVRWLKISAGSHAIGYLYNFHHNKKTYAYQSGFADEDPNFRPGYVCHALAIERDAKQGLEEYDFLAGDNRLKRSFGKTEYAIAWHRFARPSPALRVEEAARSIRTAIGF